MTHLTDSQLNEYLDRALGRSERQAVEAHMAGCGECRARLAELQRLFASLENLPERKLQSDLSAGILERLFQDAPSPRPAPRLWTPAFAAQLGLVLGAWIWFCMQAAKWAVPFLTASRFLRIAIPPFRLPIPNLSAVLTISKSLITTPPFPSFSLAFPAFTPPVFNPASITVPALPLPTAGLAGIAVCVLALGLVGNSILLRRPPEVEQ